jgi:hypothetical protein
MSNSNTYGGNGSGALFIIRYTPKG